MITCLEGFIDRLGVAQTIQETWEEVISFQRSLGFDLVEYGYAAVGSAGFEAEVATLSNFPADYQQRYRQERYYRDDPVVRYCIGNLPPLRVGRDSLDLWPDRGRGLTAIQRRIVNEAANCGMAVGVAIPLRSPGRYQLAGMSLSNDMHPAEFERFLCDCGHIAQLAALYAHTRLQMLLQTSEKDAPGVVLSPRERECLLWVSRGFTSREVASQASLSARTVDFHLASAMRKLDVATRSHAVARAFALGLLEP